MKTTSKSGSGVDAENHGSDAGLVGAFLGRHKDAVRLFVLVALLWIALAFLSGNFLTGTNVRNILVNAGPLLLVAAGLTLVIIAGELDLSVGSIIALVGTATALLTVQWGLPAPIAIALGIGIGTIVGAVNGLVVTRLKVPSFICTLATLSVVRGLALVISDGRAISGLPRGITGIAQTAPLGISLVIWIPALVVPLLALLLTKTNMGLNIYAVGGNAEAARIAGVNVRRTRMFVLVLSGFMAGIAGILSAARLGVGSPVIAEDLNLDAIAAVVIGGTSLFGGIGRVGGTVLGVVLIATIRNGLVLMNVTAFYQRIAIGLVILAASALDSMARREEP